jgi:hypothetical protein
MSEDRRKEAARRWARSQVRGPRSRGGERNIEDAEQGENSVQRGPKQEDSSRDLSDLDSDSERTRSEVPTGELEERKEALRRRKERAGRIYAELREVAQGVEEEPIGLRRKRQALIEEERAAQRRIEEIEEEISLRPEEEQKLREALRNAKEAGRRARLAHGQRERKAGIERARALLKASRLRRSIMDWSVWMGSQDIEPVDARMEAEGLGAPLDALEAWGPSDKPDIGDGGKAVLEAAEKIADAARAGVDFPEHESLPRRIYIESVERALEKLSEEERDHVRGELMERGQKEFKQAEREVRRGEQAKDARESLKPILGRAEEKKGRAIARAEALDEVQRRFESLEEPVQGRLREELSDYRERQLEEAVRPGRPSAEEIRASRREQEREGQNRGKGRGRSQDEGQGQGQNRGREQSREGGQSRWMGPRR